jgi:hypothetical protein
VTIAAGPSQPEVTNMRFEVLLRHSGDPNLFAAETSGQTVAKDTFHHVATIDAGSTDEAYAIAQNGNPDLDNPTLTWARDHRVVLTDEGGRLKCREMNDSLRSLCVGDILISGEVWMVVGDGWRMLEDTGISYRVV